MILLAFASAAALALSSDTVQVRGTVFDSIAAHPIAGASVQLARQDSAHTTERFTALTDSAGAFTIRGVPAGRYLAGFYHPLLDSLGLELPDRVIDVGAAGAAVATVATVATVAFATPSPATMIREFCGDSASISNPTLIFGRVHDPRSELDVENAVVTVTWADVEQSAAGLDVVDRKGTATTRRGGVFALCGAPEDVALSISVARAKDSAAVVTRLDANGVLHLSLFMGAPGATGRIVGHVVDKAKHAVANAHVAVGDREATASNGGVFSLDRVRTGSQTVDVRALGYSPLSFLANVAEGRPTTIDVSLERVVMLPGVVSTDAVASAHLAEYMTDKRNGATDTRFIEPNRIPGYKAQQTACQLVSAVLGHPTRCAGCPAFFLNGTRTILPIEDVDPDDIIGVEVFGAHPPAHYAIQYTMMRLIPVCGIVVWTRCPGVAVPKCGDNPASNPLNRPPEQDFTLFRR